MTNLSGAFHPPFTRLSPTFHVGEIEGKALKTQANVYHLSQIRRKDE